MIMTSSFLWLLTLALMLGLYSALRMKRKELELLRRVRDLDGQGEFVHGVKELVSSFMKRTLGRPEGFGSDPPSSEDIEEYYSWFHNRFVKPLSLYLKRKSSGRTSYVVFPLAAIACIGMGAAFVIIAKDVYLRGLLLILPLMVMVVGLCCWFFRLQSVMVAKSICSTLLILDSLELLKMTTQRP